MGVTKTELFTPAQNELANMAKVLAHPARVAIIEYLLRMDACVNGDLVEELGLAQATISQHLRELKDIGLIEGSIEGARISYCIHAPRWNVVKNAFDELFNRYEKPHNKGCC